MINEIEALFGIFIAVMVTYMFIFRRSKVIGGGFLIFTGLATLPIFGGTDYEMISWIIIIVCVVAVIVEFAHGKMGATKS